MLGIYAQTFMTATRTGCVLVKDHPKAPATKRHWWQRRTTRCIDPAKL